MSALESDDPRSVGDYRILNRLGAGGMGRVFLGRSPGGRLVAVKVVHADLLRRPEFRTRFRREVQAARMVSGAFTAPVIDADPDAPLPWLVTSYIAGPSLEQAVAERGPLDAGAVLGLAAGLAEALVSIHSVNLVHRDLKPSNVLLAEDGPRVIDFGIVRSVESDSTTGTGHIAGSPGFMSPEQINGGRVTPATDIFCLGAVLTFAATGGNPFGSGPTPALLYRVVHNEPDVASVADPTVRALIAACLAKDPARRPTPREILGWVGSTGAETTTLLRHTGQWPSAVDPAHVSGPLGAAADGDDVTGAFGTDPSAHTDVLRAFPHDGFLDPTAGPQTASPPHQAVASRIPLASQQAADPGTVSAPHQPTAPHSYHPHPATRVDPTWPSLPGDPSGPTKSGEPPSVHGHGHGHGHDDPGGRSRRVFLFSGAGAVAAVGVGTGFWFNRPGDDKKKGRDAARTGASPSSSASAVTALPRAVGIWPLDEISGALARDTVAGNDGTATDVRWATGDGGGAEFDGSRSQIVTGGPVLKTGAGRSFTVAAWVRLSAVPGSFATAVSQEAGSASGLYLQYSSDEKRWAFARPGLRAVSYTVPAADAWTHLIGVCDGPGRKLRLYVNGVQEAAVEDTNPTPAPGPLMIGRATYNGQAGDFFPGTIRDVRVFDQALTATRVALVAVALRG
ncbi:serine/threonine protein kinase [Streptomyces sp. LBL]|uniref:protein kinase domain-containing protein n=1 Tax=Streptomyces sp. LBL TaxID=2940562 RepID=UPI0024769C40|nr:LamG-like jellyroll fold domain-containing protein [Streptomyces sp. LBL]MDH6623877.1 serine/threonine protein kinase [Streptomyces sp. LBL]